MAYKSSDSYKDLLAQDKGNIILTGAAGTGKTQFLIEKISHFNQSNICSTDAMLVLSSSFECVRRLKMKLKASGLSEKLPNCTILKSECMKFLRSNIENMGFPRNFIMYSTDQCVQVLNTVLKELQLDPRDIDALLVYYEIRRLKNSMKVDWWDANCDWSNIHNDETICRIFKLYQEVLRVNHILDEDDLVYLSLKLCQSSPEFLSKFTKEYRYLFIDEFESLNQLEMALIEYLSHTFSLMAMAGDLNQNIYSLKGAKYEKLPNLINRFESPTVVNFDVEHRFTRSISAAINAVMKKQENWTELKNPKSDSPLNNKGESLSYYIAYDERDEAEYIVNEINFLMREHGLRYRDFAVLYRVPSQAGILDEVMFEKHVPSRHLKSVPFKEHPEILALFCYLCLVVNIHDNYAFSKVATHSACAFSSDVLEKMLEFSEKERKSLFELCKSTHFPVPHHYIERMREFFHMIIEFQEYYQQNTTDLRGLIEFILKKTGYTQQLMIENSIMSYEKIGYIYEWLSLIDDEHFLLDDIIMRYVFSGDREGVLETGDVVTLASIEEAKGSSFRVVFVVGVEQGLMPHFRAQCDLDALLEEKRYFYSAVTRSQEWLYFTLANQRALFGDTWHDDISSFIKDIPKSCLAFFVSERLKGFDETLLKRLENEGINYQIESIKNEDSGFQLTRDFKTGDTVDHPVWGHGIVQRVEGTMDHKMLHITFSDQDRRLMAKYATFMKQ